jgi:hypothetical protein
MTDEHSIYVKNRKLIMTKWPQILHYIESLEGEVDVTFVDDKPEITLAYEGRHLSSCYNRLHEATIQNSTIPFSASCAHLYGIGLGDAACELLQRKLLKKLDIYLLSPIVFYLYLNFFDAAWLSDSRIDLHLAHEEVLQFPYSVNAGDLAFAEDKALTVKNLIEIDRNKRNEHQFHQKQSLVYQENLQKNQFLMEKDEYVEVLTNIHKDKECVIVAGGPTASEQWGWISKRRDELIIIAVNTALIALEIAGIIPDYVVAIDLNAVVAKHFAVQNPQNYQNKTLVYYPTASYEAVKAWTGRRLIALSAASPLLKELVRKQPRSVLYTGGSVAHTATALAILLGITKIILVGFDFCFAKGESHIQNNPLKQRVPDNPDYWLFNGYNKKVPSLLNLVGYKEAMEEFIAAHPTVRFYNTGREGAQIKGAEWMR